MLGRLDIDTAVKMEVNRQEIGTGTNAEIYRRTHTFIHTYLGMKNNI